MSSLCTVLIVIIRRQFYNNKKKETTYSQTQKTLGLVAGLQVRRLGHAGRRKREIPTSL